jgi:hypothetical protein
MALSPQKLYQAHQSYKEASLKKRRFKHAEVLSFIKKHAYEKMVLGKSFEGREIIKVKIGEGPQNILLWSQMHGNEATATMAIADIFNFFANKNDGFDPLRKKIEEKLSLHFIPMLNPDGAERFIRRTAQGIDMNRDARLLQCPESQILKTQVMQLEPSYSFNLHDQGTRYSAGHSPKQATVSFLATAYNEAREWNSNRTQSAQLICYMNNVLQAFVPGGIGRFSDEFEPRAFGDNIQKWGSSLVLIESGGLKGDPEKQEIRRLNFVAILSALEAIADGLHLKYTVEAYESIPQNQKSLFDVLIKNVQIKKGNKIYQVELGINIDEKNKAAATSFDLESVIEDIGDLLGFYGIETIDAENAEIESVSLHPDLIQKFALKTKDIVEINEGNRATFVLKKESKKHLWLNGKLMS